VQLLEVSEQLRQKYLAQAQACPLPFLIKALEINNQCDIGYRAANNKRLHLEIALLKMCALCSQTLTMPTAQAQPVQVAQNKPAQQPVSQGVGQTHVSAPTPTMTTGPAPLPPTHNPNPIQTTTPQPSNNSTIQQSTVQQSTAPVSTGSTSATTAQPIVRPRGTTSGISVNKAMQQAEQKAEEKEETWDKTFTQENLSAAWNEFIDKNRKEYPAFTAAMGKYIPNANGNEIQFNVDNHLFEQDAKAMDSLKTHLKNVLHNNQFKLQLIKMERPAEIEAYTDKDKFEKMVEERPYLRTLQTELKLEGDL
jgi:DNA polymerase-3 subunit gamma/tau